MANLIKLSNDLEYVPKEQLIQMSQNPDSTYPSYLVLAEIQRRTQNEKSLCCTTTTTRNYSC